MEKHHFGTNPLNLPLKTARKLVKIYFFMIVIAYLVVFIMTAIIFYNIDNRVLCGLYLRLLIGFSVLVALFIHIVKKKTKLEQVPWSFGPPKK